MTKELLQQALDALIDSVDLVANVHAEAVELYGNYPSRQERIVGLKRELDAHEAAIYALREAIAQPAPDGMKIVGYQYQWTNPADNPKSDAFLTEWKAVEPRWNGVVQEKINELLAYRYAGKPTYRVRALYTPTNIAQPLQPATSDALKQAHKLGFLRCAEWAGRDDLLADIGSEAYRKNREHDLSHR